jgi:hypothetical protein
MELRSSYNLNKSIDSNKYMSKLKESRVLERTRNHTNMQYRPVTPPNIGSRSVTPIKQRVDQVMQNTKKRLKSALKNASANKCEKTLSVRWADDMQKSLEKYPSVEKDQLVIEQNKKIKVNMLSSERPRNSRCSNSSKQSYESVNAAKHASQNVTEMIKENRGSVEILSNRASKFEEK